MRFFVHGHVLLSVSCCVLYLDVRFESWNHYPVTIFSSAAFSKERLMFPFRMFSYFVSSLCYWNVPCTPGCSTNLKSLCIKFRGKPAFIVPTLSWSVFRGMGWSVCDLCFFYVEQSLNQFAEFSLRRSVFFVYRICLQNVSNLMGCSFENYAINPFF